MFNRGTSLDSGLLDCGIWYLYFWHAKDVIRDENELPTRALPTASTSTPWEGKVEDGGRDAPADQEGFKDEFGKNVM